MKWTARIWWFWYKNRKPNTLSSLLTLSPYCSLTALSGSCSSLLSSHSLAHSLSILLTAGSDFFSSNLLVMCWRNPWRHLPLTLLGSHLSQHSLVLSLPTFLICWSWRLCCSDPSNHSDLGGRMYLVARSGGYGRLPPPLQAAACWWLGEGVYGSAVIHHSESFSWPHHCQIWVDGGLLPHLTLIGSSSSCWDAAIVMLSGQLVDGMMMILTSEMAVFRNT
jgi:hypothetical protein